MADPEEYRTKEEVEEWRERDPIKAFADRLVDEGVLSQEDVERFDHEAIAVVDDAVKFADESPFPELDSLYDDVYVYDSDVPAWWTVDERSPEVHRGEREREAGDVPHQLAEPGAAYAGVERRARLARRGPRTSPASRTRDAELMPTMRYREALNQALREEMQEDENVFLMGEDIGVFQGAFKVTAGLLEEFGEKRVRDTPISENTIVGMGVGAAMVGLRPVVELMTINFSLLAMDQIVNHAARDPLHVRRPGQGADGGAHAAGRRPPARADPLAQLRGVLPPRARPAGRGAVHGG